MVGSTFHDIWSLPKNPLENVRWRMKVRRLALKDKKLQAALIEACRLDVLFWIQFACVGGDTLVVTKRGPVPITEVTPDDLVWDGERWVQQEGVLCQGRKSTIFGYGIELTPNHKVWTTHGWQDASSGYDRAAIRLPDGYPAGGIVSEDDASRVVVPVRLRQRKGCRWRQSATRTVKKLRLPTASRADTDSWINRHADLFDLARHVRALLQSAKSGLQALWRERNSCLRALVHSRELCGGHGQPAGWSDARPDRQRQQLRADQLSVGNSETTGEQYPEKRNHSYLPREPNVHRTSKTRGDFQNSLVLSPVQGTEGRSTSCSRPQRTVLVYDLLNCGPRRAFTVLDRDGSPLLVHNCWLYEPRAVIRFIPFCTWPTQDPFILGMKDCIDHSIRHPEDKKDFGVEKSRAEGATWCFLMLVLWYWRFDPLFACGLVSRNEECVDSSLSPDALMPKLDWQLSYQPKWLLPLGFDPAKHRRFKSHMLLNPENGATIQGFPATGDTGAGGRKSVFFLDELGRFKPGEDWLALSATQHVTNCRGLIGSYRGETGAFYQTMQQETGMTKFRLHWSDNPARNRLLYRHTAEGNEPVHKDDLAALRAYEASHPGLLKRLKLRGFFQTGQLRNPMYDNECDRLGTTPRAIAEEMDINPSGVQAKLFSLELVQRLRQTTVCPPVATGELIYDSLTYEPEHFLKVPEGRLRLWLPIGPDARPPVSRYALGLDLAMGGQTEWSSNSAVVGMDLISGHQVCEFITNALDGREMAELTTALAKWFWGAVVNFDATGPAGSAFYRRICQDGLWGNLYYGIDPRGKRRANPGSASYTAAYKLNFLTALAAAMELGNFVPRSEMLLKECLQFEIRHEKAEHVGERNTTNEGAKGAAHGDVAVAGALCWMAAQQVFQDWGPERAHQRSLETVELPPEEIPRECYAARRLAAQLAEGRRRDWRKVS